MLWATKRPPGWPKPAWPPLSSRPQKKDWLLALPRKNFTIRDYEMSGEQRSQYLQMVEKRFPLLFEISKAGHFTGRCKAIAKFAKPSAQIQTGFIYDEQGDAHELASPPVRETQRLNLRRQFLRRRESEARWW